MDLIAQRQMLVEAGFEQFLDALFHNCKTDGSITIEDLRAQITEKICNTEPRELTQLFDTISVIIRIFAQKDSVTISTI